MLRNIRLDEPAVLVSRRAKSKRLSNCPSHGPKLKICGSYCAGDCGEKKKVSAITLIKHMSSVRAFMSRDGSGHMFRSSRPMRSGHCGRHRRISLAGSNPSKPCYRQPSSRTALDGRHSTYTGCDETNA